MKREFYIDTPLGKLKVWAKHDTDNPEDFPGVYVDLVQDGRDPELLACVEYDSVTECLQTCVYQPELDEPTALVVHEIYDWRESMKRRCEKITVTAVLDTPEPTVTVQSEDAMPANYSLTTDSYESVADSVAEAVRDYLLGLG